jgi:exopolyphosphatase/guanosine-5'-triphosphate,3'-diphosphate pyrophosphatase
MWARSDRLRLVPVAQAAGAEDAPQDFAVLDVGSNSVRLVLYRVEGRAIWTVFNEKVLAGLGRDMARTGLLSKDGVVAALGALKRFRAVLAAVRPSNVFTAATAAVREAGDRDAFLARVRAETGFELRVLSGEEEAHYAALGVVAGEPSAGGVVGDLGGSSLELIRLEGGLPGPGVTLPLGPFALGAPGPVDPLALAARCDAVLAGVADRFRGGCFHAVGGAWRNLAIVRMNRVGYPLQIVHQFEMTAAEAIETAGLVASLSRGSLERMPGISKKRAETMPYAATVLRSLVERLEFERIVISSYGLREGLLYDAMPSTVRALDPLVAGCAALGMRHGVADRLGPALEAWLNPLWSRLDPLFEPEREPILLAAACRLADIGARLHPDHRADLVFDQVLRAPIPGQSHPERVFLATAAFHRYAGERAPADVAVRRVLTPERVDRAAMLGGAIRLGCDLSGRSPELLAASSISAGKADVTLTVQREAADLLLGEQTTKRAEALARALELELKVRVR